MINSVDDTSLPHDVNGEGVASVSSDLRAILSGCADELSAVEARRHRQTARSLNNTRPGVQFSASHVNAGVVGPAASRPQQQNVPSAPSGHISSSVSSHSNGSNQTGGYYPNSTNPNVNTHFAKGSMLSESDVVLIADVLTRTHPVRGAAVVALARDLVNRRFVTGGIVIALSLAIDLLEAESDTVCETLTRLLTDGWEQGIGAAFRAARTL